MKPAKVKKIINSILLLSSLIGYLQWGGNRHAFIVETEVLVLGKLFTHPIEVAHPFTIIPLAGQLLLLYTLFQKEPGKWPSFAGIGFIGILMLLVLFTGLASLKTATILSCLPFLITAVIAAIYYRKYPKQRKLIAQ